MNSVAAACAVALLAIVYALATMHTHVFDKDKLKSIATSAIASSNTSEGVIRATVTALQAEWPDYITQGRYEDLEWMFNNAGGAMGAMIVLHASVSEYVIIFGTAVGTEGHTGRFFADDYFTILRGEQWAAPAGGLTKEVYRPGDQHHLPWGSAKQYRMPDECWALEYARGHILTMMPFGLWDTFSSTVDLVTLWQTVRASTVSMLKHALQGKL